MSATSSLHGSASNLSSSARFSGVMRSPARSKSSFWGSKPIGVVCAETFPSTRSHIHLSTLLFSPNPGHNHLPSGVLRSRRGPEKDAVLPVKSFVHERHQARTAAAEDKNVDRNTFRFFPIAANRRALGGGDGKARVRMSGGLLDVGRPRTALPVDRVGGRRTIYSFPPD